MLNTTWPYMLPLFKEPKKRVKLLMQLFSSPIVMEVLEAIGSAGFISQKDLINTLRQHSNKTIITILRKLVNAGILEENVVRKRSGLRTVWSKYYKLTDFGKWFYTLIVDPAKIPKGELRNLMSDIYELFGKSIYDVTRYLDLDPISSIKHVLYGLAKYIMKGHNGKDIELLIAGGLSLDHYFKAMNYELSYIRSFLGGDGPIISLITGKLGLKTGILAEVACDIWSLKWLINLKKSNISLNYIKLSKDKSISENMIIYSAKEDQLRIYRVISKDKATSPNVDEVEWNRLYDLKAYYAGNTFIEVACKLSELARTSNSFFIYRPISESVIQNPYLFKKIIENKPILVISKNTYNEIHENLGISYERLIDLGVKALLLISKPTHITVFTSHSKRVEMMVEGLKIRNLINTTNTLISFLVYHLLKGEEFVDSAKKALTAAAVMSTRSMPFAFPSQDEVERWNVYISIK